MFKLREGRGEALTQRALYYILTVRQFGGCYSSLTKKLRIKKLAL
jgi:hypothetical protein